jgi:hypothetical protein
MAVDIRLLEADADPAAAMKKSEVAIRRIAVRCSRGVPDLMKIGAQRLNAAQLLIADHARLLLLFAPQLRFRTSHVAQAALPFGFQAARDKAILGFDCPITALSLFGVV